MPEPSITCPNCGMTSYNPSDIANKYCGNCGVFWGDLTQFLALMAEGRLWVKEWQQQDEKP